MLYNYKCLTYLAPGSLPRIRAISFRKITLQSFLYIEILGIDVPRHSWIYIMWHSYIHTYIHRYILHIQYKIARKEIFDPQLGAIAF